ncbi:MAG: outer membrane protein assembly factor BamA [Candidatus Kapabacteria bacterium]|nr:outer membrane protein assembly factor BamA [Ignavibacteriota bacterium]MCW5883545.1 outer membrane protein assembly factor BamA [Candidatus Kapabacteria bacterium]
MLKKIVLFLLTALTLSAELSAQGGMQMQQPQQYTIAGVTVRGNQFADTESIIALSGLVPGESIRLVNDPKVQKAIQTLWGRKQFSFVDIKLDRITDMGVFLEIVVKENPRVSAVIIEDNDDINDNDIIEAVGKMRGDIVSKYDLYLAERSVEALYEKEGSPFTRVKANFEDTDTNAYTRILVKVNEGTNFKVRSIRFEGSENFSDGELSGAFEETKTKSWWQVWRSAKFEMKKYEDDKKLLEKFFQKNGFIDAFIVKDSVIYDADKKAVHIIITVDEGPKVYVRNIRFEGNTVYPDEVLLRRLEFKTGDVYNVERFQQNLTGNENQTDASSLYLDNGYLQARMMPEILRLPPDSVDILVNVYENERFKIGKVTIVGNTKTKDKVVRRELFTRPGDFFDRSAIIRSIRALQVLQYFNPETLRPDIKPTENDNTAVDIVYKVEERSTDTFNASIGFAGSFGLTGAVGFTFNNFSITEPLKGGGGQIFNFNWEFGQANRYRNFSLGVTEPWLFDEPTTVGFNVFDTYFNFQDLDQSRTGIGINIGRRFRWPDDYWRADWSTRLQINDNKTESFFFRQGKFTEVTIGQRLSRISLNHMFFPTAGSRFSYSTNFAMGAIGIGQVDYFKNELNFDMYNALAKVEGNDRLVAMLSTRFGYLAGFKSDTTISPIELYRMGGNGLSGFSVTPLRGYPDNQIGPGAGSKVMAKYTAELRFAISLDPMPIYVYGFAEAGNVWGDLRSTNPFDLKRSAGFGIQMMVMPIGIMGFSYGYGFDTLSNGEQSGWRFLFHLGQ